MTEILDVAHLAARQMRAARLLHAAIEEHRAAREALDPGDAWSSAANTRHSRAAAEVSRLRKEHKAALAAYNAACDAIDLHPHADQPALFDEEAR